MKKVFCSITKLGKSGNFKISSGIGFIADDNLIAICKSKAGKMYKRVFEDCIKDCRPIPNKPNEFKGIFYEIKEIEVESKPNSFSTLEITIDKNELLSYIDRLLEEDTEYHKFIKLQEARRKK